MGLGLDWKSWGERRSEEKGAVSLPLVKRKEGGFMNLSTGGRGRRQKSPLGQRGRLNVDERRCTRGRKKLQRKVAYESRGRSQEERCSEGTRTLIAVLLRRMSPN